ncbi:phage protein [Alkalihalophilus pseudofirmus OF4]|uniref:Phage protein n=1 Tax=Alkalihalophilus pseudofirmus (strain ATCC BAA-2126 / JCM 17055 / OF4) TaxID=398511 RepID=D3FQV5_ALKPO|nr:DUF4041 domain-containing protein [Alkalihalophilus pseudofirmus]ADC51475.1 phage protein [Alkalihalophilus pseudofirmus OF4]
MLKQKWYLSTWFISIWFALSYFILPFFIGLILLALQIIDNKKRNKEWKEQGLDDLAKVKQLTIDLEKENDNLIVQKEKVKMDISKEEEQLQLIKSELVSYEEEHLYQTFGFYEPKYGFENSEKYKEQLDIIRDKQKQMAKDDTATNSKRWQVDGSEKKGEALRKDNVKIAVRAFNQECDIAISKVKFNNIDTVEKQIKKAREQINRLNKRNGVEIKLDYLALKIEELYLAYEYQVKKEEEKEEQRILKEQMREEKRIQAEIDRERKKLEKDEKHFNQALEKYKQQLEKASDELKLEIEVKISEIEEKMSEIQKEKEQVDYRAQNAKAGYVYIISNIGSFGENMFKIGMTRRLEPMERINELGNASVPFYFDVHAMVFSEDAPKLESLLHKEFEKYRVNKVNHRKEFFKVDINEIARVVKENHNNTVEFTKLAVAEEFRKSLQIAKETDQEKAYDEVAAG